MQYSTVSYGSEGESGTGGEGAQVQYSTVSYGSEGKRNIKNRMLPVQYSTVSYGSEGLIKKYFILTPVQYSTVSYGSEGLSSINSDGSEELYFIYNIIDSLFTCFFLRDSLKQMCRDLFL